jgi:hypothetical protein
VPSLHSTTAVIAVRVRAGVGDQPAPPTTRLTSRAVKSGAQIRFEGGWAASPLMSPRPRAPVKQPKPLRGNCHCVGGEPGFEDAAASACAAGLREARRYGSQNHTHHQRRQTDSAWLWLLATPDRLVVAAPDQPRRMAPFRQAPVAQWIEQRFMKSLPRSGDLPVRLVTTLARASWVDARARVSHRAVVCVCVARDRWARASAARSTMSWVLSWGWRVISGSLRR